MLSLQILVSRDQTVADFVPMYRERGQVVDCAFVLFRGWLFC
jgi:hypothetical protein